MGAISSSAFWGKVGAGIGLFALSFSAMFLLIASLNQGLAGLPVRQSLGVIGIPIHFLGMVLVLLFSRGESRILGLVFGLLAGLFWLFLTMNGPL